MTKDEKELLKVELIALVIVLAIVSVDYLCKR